MNRPKLEVASWIAGITGTIVAILVAIPWSCSAKVSADKPAANVTSTSPVGPAVDPASQSPAIAATTRSSITDALAVAREIYGTREKNAELERLTRVAIRRGEYSAALESTLLVYGSTQKDELLDLVSCYAAYAGDGSTARKAAGEIYGTSTKNVALLRLSQISSTKPGEGPNEPQCKAL